ncbi:MAG TPA: mycothiol system anti-sigma-R factor [Cytophagaceae bacterium]|jgi:mycothiol system anti-sigma-R factor
MTPFLNKEQEKCNECLQNLHLLIDDEADATQKNYFQSHLEECTPCFKAYNLEKTVKELVQNKVANKPIPQNLLDKIREKIGHFVA